jgi:4a-hydroxytetrahydrobiopterin dehydratase
MREAVLSEAEVLDALSGADGPDWHLIGGKLMKTTVCATFADALAYVLEVGRLAEEHNHHPDIDIRYNRVTLALITHDSGGITRLDLALARAVDGLGPPTA